jgi:Sortase domain
MAATRRPAASAAARRPGREASPPPARPARGVSRTPARPGRACKALWVLALTLALGSCAVPPAQPAGPGAVAPAPAGVLGTPAGRPGDPARPRPGIDVPAAPPAAPGFEVAAAPHQLSVPGPASPPVRLAIPAIRVATPLVRLGRERDGSMQVPDDFARAGWFAEGPSPGQVGPAALAGHVDSTTGPAVFFRLRELRPGDTVGVELADRIRLTFVVEEARSFPKAAFPTAEVFGPVPWAALRLVTCGGDFDRARGSYRDNLVVFARLAGVSR